MTEGNIKLIKNFMALIPESDENFIPITPIEFDITDAAISQLRIQLEVKPVTNTKEFKENANSIALVRTLRVNVEKRRKELKKDVVAYGKQVDHEARRITAALLTIEEPLNEVKQAYEAEKAAILAEKRRKEEVRIAAIKQAIDEIRHCPIEFASATIKQIKKIRETLLCDLDFDYQEFAQEALQVKTKALDELKQLQTRREDQERQEKEAEEKRIALEKQEAELKVEREKLDKEREEAKKIADAQAQRIKDEKAEAARLIKIEKDNLAKERKEITDAQAALQAERDAEKAKNDAAEKAKHPLNRDCETSRLSIKNQTALLKTTKALHEFDKEQLIEATTYISLFRFYKGKLTDEKKEQLEALQNELAKRQGRIIEHMRNAAPIMLLTLQNIWDDINAGKSVDMDALGKMIKYVKGHEFDIINHDGGSSNV